ncbi:MAG: hypothetical protein PVF58_22430 [Candidatus Methanofastidiosia archaeon]|jgi:hypothetical protein
MQKPLSIRSTREIEEKLEKLIKIEKMDKVGLQWIFTHLEGDKIIPPQVYDEVVLQGKKRGDADALISEKLVINGILHVVRIKNGFF